MVQLASVIALALTLGGCDRVFGLVGAPPIPDATRDASTDATPDQPPGVIHPYVTAVLLDNPIGYYRLGETSITTARSEVPGSPVGTYTGTYSRDQPGALPGDSNGAVLLGNASRGAVVFDEVYGFDGRLPFTLEGWLSTSAMENGRIYTLVSKGYSTPTIQGYRVFLFDGKLSFLRSMNSVALDLLDTPLPMTNEWTHFAAVFDGAQMRLYINGSLATSQSSTVSIPPSGTINFALGTGTGDIMGTLADDAYNGLLDEIAVYDEALSTQQIAQHYTAVGL